MFNVNNKNTRTTSMTSFWCFFVNFKQVNVSWDTADIVRIISLN